MITLCKCGAMTTPGEKYCKSCYIDTLKDDVSKNLFTGGRFYERRNMREQVANKMRDDYEPDIVPDFDVWADQIIALIYSEIEKVENPYTTQQADGATITFTQGVDAFGFEECRQAILSLLRPKEKEVE